MSEGKEVRNRYSVLTVLFATLGSLTYGYCTCVIGVSFAQDSFLSYLGLDTASNATQLIGAISGCYQAGGLIGALMSSYTSDKFGRRVAIFLACMFAIVGGILQTASVQVIMFIIGRLITGVGIGNLLVITPVWQSEISPPHSRGLLVGLHGTFILIGYSTAYWLGCGFQYVTPGPVQWRTPLGLQMVFPLLLAAGIFFVPESPRWLLQHGREEEALAVCKKIRASSLDPDFTFAQEEYLSIKAQYEYDSQQPSSWLAILKTPSYRRRAIIGFVALFLAQGTGTQVINNFGPTIYASLGFGSNDQLFLAAGWITLGVPTNFLSALLMDRFGRVKLMRFGWIGTGVMLLGTTITVAIGTRTGNKKVLSAAVFFIYGHIGTYATGLDASTYVYASEIWPNHLRAKGAAIGTAGLFTASFLLLISASTAFASIGWKFYLVFLILTVIACILSFFIYPEVNGLSLEESARVFGDHVEHVSVAEVHPESLGEKKSVENFA